METFVLENKDQRFIFNVGDGFAGLHAGWNSQNVWSYRFVHTVPVEEARQTWKSLVNGGFKRISLSDYAGRS